MARRSGIDVREAMSTGQLEVRPWQDGPLRNVGLDPDTWMATFEQALRLGSVTGYAHTRFLAHMEWALGQRWDDVDLFEFETRLNYVIPKYEDSIICSYDLIKFGASVMIDAMRTHPVVIISGLVHENPFFVPPDQLMVEIRERRERLAHNHVGPADRLAPIRCALNPARHDAKPQLTRTIKSPGRSAAHQR
jgi:MEDS: MEthanogen/methylotroph, DcmR Sensory domain